MQPSAIAKPKKKLRLGLPWIAAAVIVTAIIVGAVIWNLRTPEPPQVIRFDYVLPADQQPDITGNPLLAISTDGSKLAYNTLNGLYLRLMNQPTAKLIVDNEPLPKQPFFSPDGQWVGYWSQAENKLKKISISGGAPVTIVNTAANPLLPSWNDDGTIVYGEGAAGKIMRVSANGGTPELLIETQGKILFAPQILPDGESILFTQVDGSEYQIVVRSLESGESKELMSMQGTVSRYLPTGHIVYTVVNDLFAVPFDLDKLEVIGGQVSVEEDILWNGGTAAPQYAISDSGTLIYVPETTEAAIDRTLVWVDKKGNEEQIEAKPNMYQYPKISPDGTKVALTINKTGNQDIWTWDVLRENETRLTFHERTDRESVWTPDSKRIVFWSDRDKPGLYWKSADGTGKVEILASSPESPLFPFSWSAQQDKLLLGLVPSGNWGIGTLSMEGDKAPETLLNEGHTEIQPQISPDGRWMAYASDESGRMDIYVRPFPDIEAGKWQVSTGGGESPLWSPDGNELFYIVDDNFMVVSLETEPAFRPGKPEVLFSGPYVSGIGEGMPWDIHPDGNRFLMIKTSAATGAVAQQFRINIVANWIEELKQRVPVE